MSFAAALAVLLLSAWSLAAHAGVFPRNGDFYITYNEVSLNAKGHELAVSRTYNSKSDYVGWFGFGWGTPFETRLTIMPDQSAAISETGGGATSYFHGAVGGNDPKRVAAGVAAIVAAAKAKDKLDDAAAEAMRKSLMGSEDARLRAVKKYGLQAELPSGMPLAGRGAGGYCAGTLQRTSGGYRRDGCENVDEFDKQGNLVKRSFRGGYQIAFRVENGHPVEISDSDGQRITLEWNKDGHVSRLSASNGAQGKFEYDAGHNLVRAVNPDGNTYRYDYDGEHNLTRIRYLDDSAMVITYAKGGTATSVTERSGDRTEYTYAVDAENPNKYSTIVRKIAKGSSIAESHTHEFEDATSATGERWLQSFSDAHGDNGAHGDNDAQGDNGPTVELDDQGRITRKKYQGGMFVEFGYSSRGRVETVNINNEVTMHYSYSNDGAITLMSDSAGRTYELEYDAQKNPVRIVVTKAGKRRDLRARYNSRGTPLEISEENGATAKAELAGDGTVEYFESAEGPEAAASILGLFRLAVRSMALSRP